MADLSSSASPTDSSLLTAHPTEPVVHISIPVSTKLDRDNFLTWKSQIEPIILGYGLSDHLSETFTPPPLTLTEAGVTRVNPLSLSWIKQDQLLLGWIRSTISSPILAQYISSKTVAHLWSALHRVYSAVSAARVMDLRRSLQSSTRGGRSCSDYYTHLLGIADQLAAAGSPISDSDLVNYILTGLGPEFNSFVVTLTTRSTPVSLPELHAFLLAHENLLSTQAQPSSFSSDPQALYSAQTNRNSGRRGRGSGRQSNRGSYSGKGGPANTSGLLPTPTFNPSLGRGAGGPVNSYFHSRGSSVQNFQHSNSNRGYAGSSQPSADRPTCQICFKVGHAALECYHRFNLTYTAQPPPQLQALVNTTTNPPHEGWFLDSGATNHVTSDISTLNSFAPYTGNDQLQVGSSYQDPSTSGQAS